jgi:predicted dehydrogenase
LKRGAAAVGALSAAQLFPFPNVARARAAGDKLNCVVIGCGGRGMTHIPVAAKENLVAIVDVNEEKHAAVAKALRKGAPEGAMPQTFTDYRRMFDKIGKQIDAVFVATPNHQHALPTMIAMQLGKGVYCEKPLCHDIGEARKLRALAAKCKSPTQMGIQGHCQEGYRRLCEYIGSGAIGKITETHSWCDRSNGGVGPRGPAKPAPAGMHWDEWIGPSPYRNFHDDLDPHEWHGWYDFGNGSLGNLACHVMDGVYWALKLEHPLSIEVESMAGGTDERCSTGTRIRWDCPPRGDLPALKVFWYDGYEGAPPPATQDKGKKRLHYLPPLLGELSKQYPAEKFDSNGTLYVGEKGIIYTGCYGEKMHIVPNAKILETAQPPKTLPRPKDSFSDFLAACREGRRETASPIEYGAQLTEFALLGNLAQHAGVGKKVEWDGPNMKVANLPELNRFVQREYRKGWEH